MATYRDPYFRLNAFQEPVIPGGVTELRTHGVNGAPPEQLLNDPHPILVSGDEIAAFCRLRHQPSGELERTVEAYSWTGLNSRASSRAFWLLLVPFTMINFAGWLVPDRWRRTRLVRGLIRLLGVAFTIHYALWAMVMAVDLVAVQCGQKPRCYNQRWLGWLEAVQKTRTDIGFRRGVGIVWEVASFFPRRFHPLAPPSYAERSVPELRGRLIDLTSDGQLLLVAHAQGTLVSVAALLTLLDDPTCRHRLRRIAFITYGCMLRRLFGRAYPLAVHRADLIALKAELEHQAPSEGDQFPMPLDGRPPYWMNFGRHSDYLGGRVFTDLQRPPPPHRRSA